MIVVAIIGILAAIGFAGLSGLHRSRITEGLNLASNAKVAVVVSDGSATSIDLAQTADAWNAQMAVRSGIRCNIVNMLIMFVSQMYRHQGLLRVVAGSGCFGVRCWQRRNNHKLQHFCCWFADKF